MTCFLCKGTLRDDYSTFMADVGSSIIIVKNVPSQVCAQCGEVSYSDAVARQIEQIVDTAKKTANTEIAVLKFMDQAA
jgi:YgiT-type zinc finger domain-containing protein